jgi:hypothetical protein
LEFAIVSSNLELAQDDDADDAADGCSEDSGDLADAQLMDDGSDGGIDNN